MTRDAHCTAALKRDARVSSAHLLAPAARLDFESVQRYRHENTAGRGGGWWSDPASTSGWALACTHGPSPGEALRRGAAPDGGALRLLSQSARVEATLTLKARALEDGRPSRLVPL